MPFVHVMQPYGDFRSTNVVVGSLAENEFYRVMVEKYVRNEDDRPAGTPFGKLYFDSKDDYVKWSSYGRHAKRINITVRQNQVEDEDDDEIIE